MDKQLLVIDNTSVLLIKSTGMHSLATAACAATHLNVNDGFGGAVMPPCRIWTPMYWTSRSMVSFNFTGFLDYDSTVVRYQWGIGSKPYQADVVPVMDLKENKALKDIRYVGGTQKMMVYLAVGSSWPWHHEAACAELGQDLSSCSAVSMLACMQKPGYARCSPRPCAGVSCKHLNAVGHTGSLYDTREQQTFMW
jgi:hypothetical protein